MINPFTPLMVNRVDLFQVETRTEGFDTLLDKTLIDYDVPSLVQSLSHQSQDGTTVQEWSIKFPQGVEVRPGMVVTVTKGPSDLSGRSFKIQTVSCDGWLDYVIRTTATTVEHYDPQGGVSLG